MNYKVFRTFVNGIEQRHVGLIATGELICDSSIYEEIYGNSMDFYWTFDSSFYVCPNAVQHFNLKMDDLVKDGYTIPQAFFHIFIDLMKSYPGMKQENYDKYCKILSTYFGDE